MGFAHIWIKWIIACVSPVTFSVLLNGNAHGFIRPERGIRHGDPLSPFLFILCAETLVSRLNKSEAEGKLTGIKIGRCVSFQTPVIIRRRQPPVVQIV